MRKDLGNEKNQSLSLDGTQAPATNIRELPLESNYSSPRARRLPAAAGGATWRDLGETVRAALIAGSVWLWLGVLAVLPRLVSVAEGVPLIESRWLWPIALLSWAPIVGLLFLWWRWARRAHRPPSPPKPLRHRVLIWVSILPGAAFLAADIAQTAWFYVTDARDRHGAARNLRRNSATTSERAWLTAIRVRRLDKGRVVAALPH